MILTFNYGPLDGTTHEVNLTYSMYEECSHKDTVMFSAFMNQYPMPDGVWAHTFAKYEVYGNNAHFDAIEISYHNHRYSSTRKSCKCNEPGY